MNFLKSILPEHAVIFSGANISAKVEAGRELITVIGISLCPFLIGYFAFMLVKPPIFPENNALLFYLSAVFLRGQLFLLSVSFIATSLYRLFNSDRSYRRPDIINIFTLLLFGIIGVFYGINPTFAELEDQFAVNISMFFFIFSIIFYYYTAVLAFERPQSVEKTLNESAHALSMKLGKLGGGGNE